MTTSLRNFPCELEDALYALATADRVPTATELEELARTYPEHGEDLTEIMVEFVAEGLFSGDETVVSIGDETSPVVSRAISRFNNRLHDIKSGKKDAAKGQGRTANIFISFSREQMQTLAHDMNVNLLFLIKVRDCMIEPSTISAGFKNKLAEKARIPPSLIAAHVAGSPSVQASAFYKADQKPEIKRRQTFEEAVRNSDLSEEQQAGLLSL